MSSREHGFGSDLNRAAESEALASASSAEDMVSQRVVAARRRRIGTNRYIDGKACDGNTMLETFVK
jgi:hypothetical protein